MSEPILEEMLRRAQHLAMTRGRRVDANLHDWEWMFNHHRITCTVREDDDQVLISLRETPDRSSPRLWIHFVDMDQESDSLYLPEHYEEATAVMRDLMVLDDLADV